MSEPIENHVAAALARLLRTERHAVCRAAARLRDEAVAPAVAELWSALAVTAAEVDDAERELLSRLSGGSGAATCEGYPGGV